MLVLLAAVWLFGWFGPVAATTPLGLYVTRPEFHGNGGNLLLGNPQHIIMTPWLLDVSTAAWNADDIVTGLQALSEEARSGRTVYYPVYSEEERSADPQKKDVGLYCLRADSEELRPYVLLFSGGGFSSVCTMEESLPTASAFRDMGYTVFMGTYRLSGQFGVFQDRELLAEDIAHCVRFITEHAEEFNVLTEDYLIGGFSAGACTETCWCVPETGYKKYDLPRPGAAVFMYGMDWELMEGVDVPSLIYFCVDDPYFSKNLPERFSQSLGERDIAWELNYIHALHGFGLGTGTEAEGWPQKAVRFWQSAIE